MKELGFESGSQRKGDDLKPLSPSELLVQRVVESELGVALRRSDFNAGQARHDFELLHDDEPFAALEVTEDRDPSDAQWRHLSEPLLPVPGCHHGWVINLWNAPTQPNKWSRSDAAPFLHSLEASGAGRHTIYPDSPSALSVPASLSALGYVAAELDPQLSAGQLRLVRAGWGESITSTDELTAWVSTFVNSSRCSGERSKLATSGFGDRHLAVVIPFAPAAGRRVFDLLLAVETFGIPLWQPTLPMEVGTFWLVSDYPGVRSLRVSSEGWAATDPASPIIATEGNVN
jgi:hypothetical protein